MRQMVLSGQVAGRRDAYRNCATIFPSEVCMEDRAPVVSPAEQSSTTISKHQHEGRGAWVLTAYSVSALALFGVLAYFFSDFISH
jgi:hypothetical protein